MGTSLKGESELHLNLLKLHIVELLDKHQKITAVADLLGLKQPTVTFHMKNLEKEMGLSSSMHVWVESCHGCGTCLTALFGQN